MINKGAALLFIFISCCAHSSEVKHEEYCATVSYLNLSVRQDVSPFGNNSPACQKWKRDKRIKALGMPVEFSGIGISVGEIATISRAKKEAPGEVPEFVVYDMRQNKYIFDWEMHEDAVNTWPIYQGRFETMRANGEVSIEPSFKSGGDAHEGYVICEIIYKDETGERAWKEGFFSYYYAGKISVWYWTPLLSEKIPDDIKFFEKLTALFASMKYVGN